MTVPIRTGQRLTIARRLGPHAPRINSPDLQKLARPIAGAITGATDHQATPKDPRQHVGKQPTHRPWRGSTIPPNHSGRAQASPPLHRWLAAPALLTLLVLAHPQPTGSLIGLDI